MVNKGIGRVYWTSIIIERGFQLAIFTLFKCHYLQRVIHLVLLDAKIIKDIFF